MFLIPQFPRFDCCVKYIYLFANDFNNVFLKSQGSGYYGIPEDDDEEEVRESSSSSMKNVPDDPILKV